MPIFGHRIIGLRASQVVQRIEGVQNPGTNDIPVFNQLECSVSFLSFVS